MVLLSSFNTEMHSQRDLHPEPGGPPLPYCQLDAQSGGDRPGPEQLDCQSWSEKEVLVRSGAEKDSDK